MTPEQSKNLETGGGVTQIRLEGEARCFLNLQCHETHKRVRAYLQTLGNGLSSLRHFSFGRSFSKRVTLEFSTSVDPHVNTNFVLLVSRSRFFSMMGRYASFVAHLGLWSLAPKYLSYRFHPLKGISFGFRFVLFRNITRCLG